jgi:hypothetical protein
LSIMDDSSLLVVDLMELRAEGVVVAWWLHVGFGRN